MNEYEIGRDVQALRSRIEHLESVLGEHSPDARMRHTGISATHDVSGGVAQQQEPLLWKPEKQMKLPPFLYGLLGVPERLVKFNLMAESKTWTATDPMILYITWYAGGSDEFYRFQDQTFSIVRVTEPNSGHISCTGIYAARLVASGRAETTTPYSLSAYPYTATNAYSQFIITLKNAQGGLLTKSLSHPYIIKCQDNYEFTHWWDFNPGLYDLVSSATWEVGGAQPVRRC